MEYAVYDYEEFDDWIGRQKQIHLHQLSNEWVLVLGVMAGALKHEKK